ncbi:hypothetical protein V6N13_106136 [Hibiscus sabdariffa]|uniref:Uncharacterized protein n=1 Tax=Hibiscus sabdariffa TaxID=183260 RepID=A0ABR2EZR6_9ROSI
MPSFSSEIGDSYTDITTKEVGDGDLNFSDGTWGSFVIKQALSYVRLFPEHQRAGELLVLLLELAKTPLNSRRGLSWIGEVISAIRQIHW